MLLRGCKAGATAGKPFELVEERNTLEDIKELRNILRKLVLCLFHVFQDLLYIIRYHRDISRSLIVICKGILLKNPIAMHVLCRKADICIGFALRP